MSLYFHFWIFIDMFQMFSFSLWYNNVWFRFKKSNFEIKLCLYTHASTCWISTTKCTKKKVSSINSSTCISKKRRHFHWKNVETSLTLTRTRMHHWKKTSSIMTKWNTKKKRNHEMRCVIIFFVMNWRSCEKKNFVIQDSVYFLWKFISKTFSFFWKIFSHVFIYIQRTFLWQKIITNCHEFRKSITNRYLLKRNLYETWLKIHCISFLLILQYMLFATFILIIFIIIFK